VENKFTFIDLFAGLGGFHLALKSIGGKCVFAAEKNIKLNKLYSLNFPELSTDNIITDITKFNFSKIPNHDVLCGGFPCQPFSQAGKRKGMKDELNGSLFDSILSIIDSVDKKPKYLILENVPNILTLENGFYWKKIKASLIKRGYHIDWKIISPVDFGIPQNRKRVFIVGSLNGLNDFNWPINLNVKKNIDDYLELNPLSKKALSDEKEEALELWDYFIKKVEINGTLGFPIWSHEFGATYPVNYHPLKLDKLILKDFKGSFGFDINLNGEKSIKECLPPYVRDARKPIKPWKANFILKNRILYSNNKNWIDDWKSKIYKFPHSLQKFEWNCQNDKKEINNNIVQFRPSGIRVKQKESIPALVSNLTQIPFFPWEKRYMTVNEGFSFQGLDKLEHILGSDFENYLALGNAVNSQLVYYISKNLIK
tara:strand:- start:5169 stop:6446 length:1278 start_codon:yes stop_codon:yes gene_type:complete